MAATKAGYWHQVASVFAGAATAQAVPIFGSLIIARLYAPDEFGLYSTWLGVSLVLTVCVTYRLEHALGLEPDGAPREKLVLSALFLVVATSITILLIALILVGVKAEPYNGMTGGSILLLAPMTMGAGISAIWQSWAANNGDVRNLSYIRIWLAICVTALQVLVGWFKPTATALMLAQVVGIWLSLIASYHLLPIQHGYPHGVSQICLWISQSLRRYKRFAMLSLPADLINTAAAQMPIIVLTSRFGPEVAGFYALANRMMGAPISILGSAVRDVFKRSANEEYRLSGRCVVVYARTFAVLLVGALLMVSMVYPFSEDIFTIFFGESWRSAGSIAAWLLPMFALRFISSPLSYTFYIVQKQNVDLVWQIFLLAMTIGTLVLFSTYRDTLIYYSIGYSLLYVIYIGLSRKYSKG